MSPRRTRRLPGTHWIDSPDGREAPGEPDGEEVSRAVAGEAARKTYRCPGCDQEIRTGTPHLVAWQRDRPDDRRHWHTACWNARHRRTVKVHRAKNAPRYG